LYANLIFSNFNNHDIFVINIASRSLQRTSIGHDGKICEDLPRWKLEN
jgi:hypothetical protein